MASALQLSATRWRLTRDTPGITGSLEFEFTVIADSIQDVTTLEQMYQADFEPPLPPPPTINDDTVILLDRFSREFTKSSAATLISEGNALMVTAPVYTDHFGFGSAESGEVGEMGWSFTNGTVSYAAPVTDRPGIMTRTSAATTNSVASTYPLSGSANALLLKSNLQELHWSTLQSGLLAVATYRFGISTDAAANPPTSGFYLEALPGDTSWFAVRRNGGSEFRTDTGIPIANAWIDFRLRRISSDNWEFYVNNGQFQIINTSGNIPPETTPLIPFSQVIPATAVARFIHHDFFSLVTR